MFAKMFKFIFLFVVLTNFYVECQVLPNILFVMLDDFRPTIFGYGDLLAKTPNIDKLIKKSFYFTNMYAQVIINI